MAHWPDTLYVAQESEHVYIVAESLADLKTSKGGKQEVAVYTKSKVTKTRVAKKAEAKAPVQPDVPLANVFGTTVPAPPKEEPRPIPKKRR